MIIKHVFPLVRDFPLRPPGFPWKQSSSWDWLQWCTGLTSPGPPGASRATRAVFLYVFIVLLHNCPAAMWSEHESCSHTWEYLNIYIYNYMIITYIYIYIFTQLPRYDVHWYKVTNQLVSAGPRIYSQRSKDPTGWYWSRYPDAPGLFGAEGEVVSMWVCLKIVYPYTQWLMIIIPTKLLFHWEYTLFSDIPCGFLMILMLQFF